MRREWGRRIRSDELKKIKGLREHRLPGVGLCWRSFAGGEAELGSITGCLRKSAAMRLMPRGHAEISAPVIDAAVSVERTTAMLPNSSVVANRLLGLLRQKHVPDHLLARNSVRLCLPLDLLSARFPTGLNTAASLTQSPSEAKIERFIAA
jgi:hypothetical protein